MQSAPARARPSAAMTDPAEPDHYDILAVDPEATPAEIKRAWRRQVQLTHPDAGGSTARFQQVNQAYEVLSDPIARGMYDRRRRATAPSQSPPESHEPPATPLAPEPAPGAPTGATAPAPSRQLGPWAVLAAPGAAVVYWVAHLAMRASSAAVSGSDLVSTLGWSLIATALALFEMTIWVGLPIAIGISINGLWGLATSRTR